jgi:Protein of unknown function (DUF3752)
MPKRRIRSDDNSSGSDDDDNDDDDNSDNDSRKRRKRKDRHRSKPEKSKKKKKKHRRKRHRDDYSSSDDEDTSRKKKDRRHSKRERHEATNDDERTPTIRNIDSRIHILTQALCRLFSLRPVFIQELPILLIRLGGGATLDLRLMNDNVASTALERVLECLHEFGVQQTGGEWFFQAPPGRRDERILLRVIRTQLDQAGVTMQAVAGHEETLREPKENLPFEQPTEDKSEALNSPDPVLDKIRALTSAVVLKYQSEEAELGTQLAALCNAIACGENIFVDGLPDEELRVALEGIFVACGLEKSEMACEEPGGEGENDDKPTMGYGLPELACDAIQLRLAAVMEACRNPKRRTLGPMRPTKQDVTSKFDSDDDEGPALKGRERRPWGHSVPVHLLETKAEDRDFELQATVAGDRREEWMVVPGKHDFLDSIKSGQPIRSRGFQNNKTHSSEAAAVPIHPAVRAEMDEIMRAHQDARGPSLIDQHKAARHDNEMIKVRKKQEWTWNREMDLDAGRRVDKDALHMVLGGAADNLKTKFHGGFH